MLIQMFRVIEYMPKNVPGPGPDGRNIPIVNMVMLGQLYLTMQLNTSVIN